MVVFHVYPLRSSWRAAEQHTVTRLPATEERQYLQSQPLTTSRKSHLWFITVRSICRAVRNCLVREWTR